MITKCVPVLLIVITLIFSLFAAACTVTPNQTVAAFECTDPLGCIEVDAGDPVVIAGMHTLSGATSFFGLDSTGGIELAIEDFGTILGHEIDLQLEDSQCNAEGGQIAAQKVAANTSVVGVLGTSCSSAATAALPIIHEAGLSMISSANTSPTLTETDPDKGGVWQPGYYRTAHNDLFQGRLAAEYAYDQLGARTAATIHDGSPYADSLQQVMADTFTSMGGRITFQGAVNVGDTEMLPILIEISTDPPDVLFYPIFQPEVNFITNQIQDVAELDSTILMAADAAFSADIMENTGDSVLGLYLTSPLVVGAKYDDLLEKWINKYGDLPPSAFHAHSYDATTMLLQAIEKVALDDGSGNLLVGKQAIRDALTAIDGFDGITGNLSCSSTGDCATGEALGVYQINDMSDWPPEIVYPE